MTWTDSDSTVDDWIGEYWIGLKASTEDGSRVWKWDHNSGKSLRENSDLGWWREGEPNNAKFDGKFNGKDCAAVGSSGSEVAAAFCDDKKQVLCVRRKLFYQFSLEVQLWAADCVKDFVNNFLRDTLPYA